MGVLNTELAVAHVSFSGINDYAHSGMEERPISSHVRIERPDATYEGVSAFAVLIPLGACRLLQMLNREPQYVAPFMQLVGNAGRAILEGDPSRDFRVRDCVLTDARDLTAFVLSTGETSEAELNGGLPIVRDEIGPVERTTRLRLMMRKRNKNPWASYRFKLGSANPLTTVGAWASVLEHCVREYPYDEVGQRAAAALTLLYRGWEGMGSPHQIPQQFLALSQAMIGAVAIDDNPIAFLESVLSDSEQDSL